MQQKHLLNRTSINRHALTPFEARFWGAVSRSQIGGHKFRRQHVINNCIVDFFCPQKALIVEIDGDTHDPERDAKRDAYHASIGFQTLRFTNAEVGKNLDGVIERLLSTLDALPDRWPHPSIPSPKGEGKP